MKKEIIKEARDEEEDKKKEMRKEDAKKIDVKNLESNPIQQGYPIKILMPSNNSYELNVFSYELIPQLQKKISEQLKMKPTQVFLCLFGHRMLCKYWTMKKRGIKAGTVLKVEIDPLPLNPPKIANSSAFDINIVYVNGGIYQINVLPETTIDDVIYRFNEFADNVLDSYIDELTFREKRLEGKSTIHENFISPNDYIFAFPSLIPRIPGFPPPTLFNVDVINRKRYKLLFSNYSIIKHIKSIIARDENTTISSIEITFKGNTLNDYGTFEDYGICENDTIVVKINISATEENSEEAKANKCIKKPITYPNMPKALEQDKFKNKESIAHLICPLCFSVPSPTECLEHISCTVFCETCIKKWKKLKNSCPICRSSKAQYSDISQTLKKIMQDLIILCPNSSANCMCIWEGKWDEFQVHNKSCDFTVIECGNGCGKLFHRKDLPKHEIICPLAKSECKFCGDKICGKVMEDHVKFCLKNPETEVRCEYSSIGCKKIVKFGEMMAHLESDLASHTELTKNYVKLMNRQLSYERLKGNN